MKKAKVWVEGQEKEYLVQGCCNCPFLHVKGTQNFYKGFHWHCTRPILKNGSHILHHITTTEVASCCSLEEADEITLLKMKLGYTKQYPVNQ